jgi:hypothetical protein
MKIRTMFESIASQLDNEGVYILPNRFKRSGAVINETIEYDYLEPEIDSYYSEYGFKIVAYKCSDGKTYIYFGRDEHDGYTLVKDAIWTRPSEITIKDKVYYIRINITDNVAAIYESEEEAWAKEPTYTIENFDGKYKTIEKVVCGMADNKTMLSESILNAIISDAKEWKDARDKERGLLTTDETVAIKKRIISGEFNKCEEVVEEVSFEIMVNEYKAQNKEDAVSHMGLISTSARGFENRKVSVSVNELVGLINEGHSIYCSVLNAKRGASVKDEQFMYQQVFGVDIDHCEYNVAELLERLPYRPSIIYTTFSHTEEAPRYRVLYISKNVVEDAERAKSVRQHLINSIEGADEKCINASRVFFAGSVVYVDKEAEFDALNVVCEAVESEVGEYTPSHSISENDPIKDVIRGNLRNMVSEYGNRIVKTSYDINDIIYKLPLGMVLGLGVKVGEMFNCVLEGHSDNNASANIYTTKKKGYYMYKCFGCDSSLYITDFIDREEICEILNIRTMWYERNRDILNYNRRLIEAPEVLVEKHKNVYKKVAAYYKLCSVMLDLAEEQLERLGRTFTTDKVENIIISERYVEIARRIAEKFNAAVKADRKNVQNQLDILMLMRFVVKLTDDELAQLNPKMLMRNKNNVKSIDPKYNTQYGIMINKWDMIVLTDAEDMLVYYKEIGATTLGASQRQSIELGCDTRSKNTKSNDTPVLLDIKQCLIDYYDECVNTRGYVLKDEFMAYAKAHNTGKRLASTFITMLNRHYGLTSAIVNKDIISKYEDLSAADSKKRIFIAAA